MAQKLNHLKRVFNEDKWIYDENEKSFTHREVNLTVFYERCQYYANYPIKNNECEKNLCVKRKFKSIDDLIKNLKIAWSYRDFLHSEICEGDFNLLNDDYKFGKIQIF